MMTDMLQGNLFDYAALDTETRLVVQQAAARIKRRTAQAIVENGRDLMMVKDRLEHGQYENWLRSEFDWKLTTAWNFIQVAKVFESSKFEDLKIGTSALYLLASPSTPEHARIEALDRAESGEEITYSKARQIVNEYKDFNAILEDANDAVIEGRSPMTPPDDEPKHQRVCPYCHHVYMHVPAEVTSCPQCLQLHAYSGPRDIGTYGPYPDAVQPAPLANHQLLNASTSNEWYTPRRYLDAVHAVMGDVDLDPASNPLANENVRAARFFTIDDDGLSHDWRGRVFLNPPYGTTDGESNQARWSRHLVQEYLAGNVTEAVLLVNAVPGNQWFAPLWQFPICFPDHRIRFYNAEVEAGQPTHSNALIYLGPNVSRFVECFSVFGVVAGRLSTEDGNVSVSIKL